MSPLLLLLQRPLLPPLRWLRALCWGLPLLSCLLHLFALPGQARLN
jgi:hypothetical protein